MRVFVQGRAWAPQAELREWRRSKTVLDVSVRCNSKVENFPASLLKMHAHDAWCVMLHLD